MERERFEELVAQTVAELPEEVLSRLENVDVIVADQPTRSQLATVGPGMTLLGLYEGVPHTERDRGYSLVPPDKITIFQGPIEARGGSEAAVAKEVREVVLHEIAHHFGLDDKLLKTIEASHRRRPTRDG
ncbi:MAG: metallopeptidase family protein [Chloroflexi bacterium]|nr:metallopeptidase family protein [Chloroflexota bacterium]